MKPLDYKWPSQDSYLETPIASIQTVSGGENLKLNSSPYYYSSVSRSVGISSSDDISDAIFTITGLYKGKVVTATVTGINDSTVDTSSGSYPVLDTDVIFDVITNISVNQDVTNVSVYPGLYGHTGWVNGNYFQSSPNTSLQVIASSDTEDDTTIVWNLGVTLQDVSSIPDHLLNLVDPTTVMTNETNSVFSNMALPYVYLAFFIINSNGGDVPKLTGPNGSLEAIVVGAGNNRF
jgi:hypothetical protein